MRIVAFNIAKFSARSPGTPMLGCVGGRVSNFREIEAADPEIKPTTSRKSVSKCQPKGGARTVLEMLSYKHEETVSDNVRKTAFVDFILQS